VVSIKNNPSRRLIRKTARVLRLGGEAAVGLRLRVEGRATIILDESIAHLPSHLDGQNRIARAVLVVVGDGLGAAVAAREDGRAQDGDGADVVGAGARP